MKDRPRFLSPELRFPEFKDDWELTTLGSMLSFKNGINADKSQYGSGTKFVNVLDVMSEEPLTYENIIGSVDVPEKELEKNKVEYGDILFQRSSETREDVGVANVYVDDKASATFGGFVIRGQALDGIEYSPHYMWNLLKTCRARKETIRLGGGSTRYNIGQASLESIPIWISNDQKEQEKISQFVIRLDSKIALLYAQGQNLELLKTAMIQKIFKRQVRFCDAEGQAFPDWKELPLHKIGEFKNGFNAPKEAFGTGFPFVNLMDIFDKTEIGDPDLDLVEATATDLQNYNLLVGDVLFVRSSVKRSGVGLTCVVNKPLKNTIYSGFVIRFREHKSILTLGFKKYVFRSEHFRRQIEAIATSSANTNVNQESLMRLTVPVPHEDEQKKISRFLTVIDQRIEDLHRQATLVRDFKKGILQRLFV